MMAVLFDAESRLGKQCKRTSPGGQDNLQAPSIRKMFMSRMLEKDAGDE